MNIAHLLHVNTALILSVVTAYVIPLLSALVTKAPSAVTGLCTTLLAAISGFLAEWAASPNNFDWKTAAGTALAAWLVAVVAHSKTWAGSAVEQRLHSVGQSSVNMHTDAAPPAA